MAMKLVAAPSRRADRPRAAAQTYFREARERARREVVAEMTADQAQ